MKKRFIEFRNTLINLNNVKYITTRYVYDNKSIVFFFEKNFDLTFSYDEESYNKLREELKND